MADPVPAVPLVGQMNAWAFGVAVTTGAGVIVAGAAGETGGVLPPPPPPHAARSSEAETMSAAAAGAILMPVMVRHRSDADTVRIRRVDLVRRRRLLRERRQGCGKGRGAQQRGEDSDGSH